MQDTDKIIRELSKGYAPQREGAKPRIMKIYDKIFKPLVKRKDLDTFFTLYEYDDPILKAWAFLGIYQILENKNYLYGEDKERLDEFIVDVLNNQQKFSYYSGDIETSATIRRHHARRISWLHPDIVFEPVYEHVKQKAPEMDKVIGELLLELISKKKDPKVEILLLEFANNLSSSDIESKLLLIRSFENYGIKTELGKKEQITEVFKRFLDELWKKKKNGKENLSDDQQILEQKLIQIGANLELDLESETLRVIENLDQPFNNLDQVAEYYKDNERFRTILMQKLQQTNNQRFLKDLLKAIALIQSEIPNCQELIIEKIKTYEFNDTDLIINLMESDLLNEDTILEMIKGGEEWELEFVREFLNLYSDKLDSWERLREEITSILTRFPEKEVKLSSDSEFYKKKKFALQVVIDLKHSELVQHCLENFSELKSEELRKMALFAIITFGGDNVLLKLRKLMEKNETTRKYVKKFWDQLERRDWKFYY